MEPANRGRISGRRFSSSEKYFYYFFVIIFRRERSDDRKYVCVSYRKWELKKKKSQSSLPNITCVPVGCSPRSSLFISTTVHPSMLPSQNTCPNCTGKMCLTCLKRGAPLSRSARCSLLRYRNHPQITVIKCKEKSNPVWF